MNCKEIQDLILTDYADNEVTGAVRRQVQEHIAVCPACRTLEASVCDAALRPLQEAPKAEVPPHLWWQIKSAVQTRQERRAGVPVLERIRHLLAMPRPAFAFSTVVVLLAFGLLFVRPYFSGGTERRQLAELAIEDQIDYFAYGNGWGDNDALDAGIEEIFS